MGYKMKPKIGEGAKADASCNFEVKIKLLEMNSTKMFENNNCNISTTIFFNKIITLTHYKKFKNPKNFFFEKLLLIENFFGKILIFVQFC